MKNITLVLSFFCSLVICACPVTLDPAYDACDGDSLLLDSNGEPSYSFQWFLNGALIPGATGPTLSVTNGGTYQVDATDGSNSCSDTTVVTFNLLPPDLGPFEMRLCDDELNGSTSNDEISTFDLTSKNDEVTGNDPSLTVSWYETVADEVADNPIADPTMYQNVSVPQSVIGRITSAFGCRTVLPLTLIVLPNPSPNPSPNALQYCDEDNDGFGDFVLNDADFDIINGEPDVSIGYYETLLNAEIGDPGLQLVSPYFNVTPFTETVYARVTRETPPAVLPCFTIVALELQVLNTPDPADASFLDQVVMNDTNGDGVEEFDLTINDAAILGTQNPADFDPISFYESEIDALNQSNPIVNPTSFLSSGQTIYPLLRSLITGCYRISLFDIVVQGVPINTPPDDLFIDEGDLNGLAIFDLTVNEAQMLGSLDPSIHEFSYHITLSDANNGLNEISTPTAYQNVANPQEIHVRLTNTTNGAYGLASFVIETDGILGLETELAISFDMYPNPSNEVLFISSEILSDVAVSVYETNGKLVLTKEFEISTEIDISALANGLYYVVFTSGISKDVKQLIKN